MRQRKPLVVANWKMNGNFALVQQMSDALSVLKQPLPDILICPPVIFLAHFPKHPNYKLGAQNLSEQFVGAFTGEISADMLSAAGASSVIVGHSERRALYGEQDSVISQKVKVAIEAGLTPILCVGETLAQREEEKNFAGSCTAIGCGVCCAASFTGTFCSKLRTGLGDRHRSHRNTGTSPASASVYTSAFGAI